MNPLHTIFPLGLIVAAKSELCDPTFVSLKKGTEELGQQLVVWQERVRAHVHCP